MVPCRMLYNRKKRVRNIVKNKFLRNVRSKNNLRKKSHSLLAVERANAVTDPLELLDDEFKTYKRDSLHTTLSSYKASALNSETMNWIFNLTKSNMKQLYEECKSGWCSWNDENKLKEMTGPNSRYLIASTADKILVGFSHYCFDVDYGVEVLYCYELQLEPSFQRHGIGSFLLKTLEKIAFINNMKKVVLTALKTNLSAMHFYKSKNYTTDETSPKADANNVPMYEILSKKKCEVRSMMDSTEESVQSELVEKAISVYDHFENLDIKYKTYCKDSWEVDLISKGANELDDVMLESILKLLRNNMMDLYELSKLEWNDEEKRKILLLNNSRYIIAMSKDCKLVGYAHYRFQVKHKQAVLFCEGLQLDPNARRRGLGTFLLTILEEIASISEMKKVMLGVLKLSSEAAKFYEAVGYTPDDAPHELYPGAVQQHSKILCK